MLSPNTFEGAAAGMDNLGLGADVEALHQDTVIGTKRPRFSNRSAATHIDDDDDDESVHLECDDESASPDNAAFTTMFPRGRGGYATNSTMTKKHYVQSISHIIPLTTPKLVLQSIATPTLNPIPPPE